MIKFIHSSDFHLASSFESSSFPSKYAQERRIDIWLSVEEMIKKASEVKADFIFLTGDLFNEEYFTLGQMQRLMNLFSYSNDIKIIITTGNHDPIRMNSLWNQVLVPENVYIFKNEYLEKLEFEDIDIYGVSYRDSFLVNNTLFDNVELNSNKHNILMMHTDIINPNINYLPTSLDIIKSLNFDYVALGHIHKPTITNDNIVYPGSIEPLSFKEQGYHGAVEGVLDEDGLKLGYLDVSNSIFIEKDYIIEEKFNFYDLKDKIENEWTVKNKKNFLRLNLKGSMNGEYELDIDILEEELKKYIHYIEIIDNLEEYIDIDKLYELNENNVIGVFIREMRKKDLNNPVNKKAFKLGIKALMNKGE